MSIDANDIRAILKDQGIGYWKQAWNALLVRLIIYILYIYMDDFNVFPSSKRHVVYVQSLNDG